MTSSPDRRTGCSTASSIWPVSGPASSRCWTSSPSLSMASRPGLRRPLVLDHRIQVGQLVAFNLYITMLINPLQSIGQIIAQAQRAVASSERVSQILDAVPRRHRSSRCSAIARGPGEVRFENVRFSYANGGAPVLDGFDLTVPAGESVAVVGSTGSGKTTLARLIPRFYDVDSGRVTLDGVDVRDLLLARTSPSGGRGLRRHFSVHRHRDAPTSPSPNPGLRTSGC